MRPRQQRGMRMEIEYKNSTTDPLHSFVTIMQKELTQSYETCKTQHFPSVILQCV